MNNLFMTLLKSTTALSLAGSTRILHRLPFVQCHFGYQCLLQEAVAIVCSIKYNRKRCYHLTRHRLNVIKDCKQSGFHQHSKGPFTPPNFDPINIENFCVLDGISCSYDPVFASNYFVTSSKNFNNSCFQNFMPTSPQLDPAVAAIL